jgi:hypothetical protein
LSLYPNKKNSAIASGATPIGIARRAPDKITDYESYEAGVKVHCQKKNPRHKLLDQSLPSGGDFN